MKTKSKGCGCEMKKPVGYGKMEKSKKDMMSDKKAGIKEGSKADMIKDMKMMKPMKKK